MEIYTILIVLIIVIIGVAKIVYSSMDKNESEATHYSSQRENRSSVNQSSSQVENINRIQPNFNKKDIEIGPVIYYGNTNHNAKDVEFRFKYVMKNGSWRAYILRHPSFNGRDESLTITHRYRDPENNLLYVCWDTPLYQIKDIQSVSKAWADNILEYIATGTRFGPQ